MPGLPLEVALVATAASFSSRWGFGLDPSETLLPIVLSMEENGMIPVDDWLESCLLLWRDGFSAAKSRLSSLFEECDDNGDGVMDLEEFQGMISRLNVDVDEREVRTRALLHSAIVTQRIWQMLKMFDDAVQRSGNGDAIVKTVFVETMLRHSLLFRAGKEAVT